MWTALHTQIDFFFNTFHMENPTVGSPTYTNSDKQQLKNSPQTHAHTHARTNRQSSFGIQLGHFLKVYSDALAVKQHKVNVFQRGAGAGHKVVGDGLEDELSGCLLWESVPVGDGWTNETEEDKRHSCLWWRVAEHGNGRATAKNLSALQTCWVCRLTVTLLLNTDQWSWTYTGPGADPHC